MIQELCLLQLPYQGGHSILLVAQFLNCFWFVKIVANIALCPQQSDLRLAQVYQQLAYEWYMPQEGLVQKGNHSQHYRLSQGPHQVFYSLQ